MQAAAEQMFVPVGTRLARDLSAAVQESGMTLQEYVERAIDEQLVR
jgi:hypothetical protein